MTIRIINADVMDGLRQLPDESVHCVVTSPPYFGVRSYLPPDHPLKHLEIGSEPTLQDHIAKLVSVFDEVRRVLRKDGTLWLNYGDMWAGSWGAQSRGEPSLEKSTLSGGQIYAAPKGTHTGSKKKTGLKPKDLCMAPHRLAIALQDAGWWVRSDIIWSKPNPMPESVTDRPTKAHEYIFLLTKSQRYYYDAEAIKEYAEYGFPNAPDAIASPYGQGFTRRASATVEGARPPGTAPQSGMCRQTARIGAKGNARGFRGGSYVGGQPGPRTGRGNGSNDTLSRNKRSVWTIATVPFPEAHYATFPPELPEICIKAGCPAGGTVLDPFGGSGTTGLVADRLQRNAILIDLNPDNKPMAERRIAGDRGPLLDAMESAPQESQGHE